MSNCAQIVKRDTVIVGRAIGRRREISSNATNGECNESKPFDRAEGEPLDVAEGDGEHENLLAFHGQINIHHVGGKLVGVEECEAMGRWQDWS